MLKIIYQDGRWILLDHEDELIASSSSRDVICDLLISEQAKEEPTLLAV